MNASAWPSPRRWLALLLLAVATHLAAVWALPRFIMSRVLAGVQAELPVAQRRATDPAQDLAYFPPPSDHRQRRIVMPSPDLLYALCAFDLREQALHVRADPAAAGHRAYWSIALYGRNSDNVFVLNDQHLAGAAADLLLLGPAAAEPAPAPGRRVLRLADPRGLLLMRVLVGDARRDLPTAEAARRSLHCQPESTAPARPS